MARTKPIEANWYDYPQYYDLAFRDDTQEEADFIEAACRKYITRPVHRLLEPACGTGRQLAELASRGYQTVGFDLCRSMVRYTRDRIRRRKLDAAVYQADMADFKLPGPGIPQRKKFDAAYCLVNSFRHLLTEDDAVNHLRCVARTLRQGGLYLLGMHLLPLDASEEDVERWSASRGRTKVTITFRVLATDRKQRIEQLRTSMLVRSGEREIRVRTDYPMRMYTADQFRQLLAHADCFDLLDVYDFWYDIDEPLVLDDVISDTVFVLRRR